MKKVQVSLFAAALLLLCSCSNKLGSLSSNYFAVTPQLLEAVNGEVPVTISGTFPEKFFPKKAVITITPVLKYEGGSVSGDSYTFIGEKVEGNSQVISNKTGGNFTMKSSFDYIPEMAKSELYLEFAAKVKNKTKAMPAVKVADGVLATAELYSQTTTSTKPAYAEDAFQRVIKQAKQANIMFLIQQTNLRWSELNSADMKEFTETLKDVDADKENKVLDNIEVSAYASPDGDIDLNDRLAAQRQNNAESHVNKLLKKNKVDAYVDTEYTAEDWEGFQELVAGSNIPDKDLILRVLSMYKEPEVREREIKNISAVYSELAEEILPQLRRARLTLNYQLIGRSDDEILAALKEDASVLSVEELLYAATLVESANEKSTIYNKTVKLYPNDYRAYNNLADLSMKAGDYAAAKNHLEKAVKLNASAAEVNTNLGMLALIEGNVADAESYLIKGTDAKANEAALGNLYIAQGQYERAVSAFGDTKSNAAALAQIMSENYTAAKSTLNSVETPDAYTYYLNAIVGARTNNAAMVAENLTKAVRLDSNLRQRAINDAEFKKFASAILNL
ncbi:MAG: tetratricopeptide repeat protein [Bacteroidaceae bacterium]|nr:tetratricopeptide repeat protein [Bacteroidaceae bacterium]